MGRLLDWRAGHVGPAKPCRLCRRPALCRDERGRACHKTCAETEHALPTAAEDVGALVVDLDAYRAVWSARRSA